MGKPTGFMEFERKNKPEVEVLKRIENACFWCFDAGKEHLSHANQR